MFWYCITAQCLTPLYSYSDLSKTAGLYTTTVKADSMQDAIVSVMKQVVAPYKEKDDITAVVNYENRTVALMDERAHIVNYFWGFRGHRI